MGVKDLHKIWRDAGFVRRFKDDSDLIKHLKLHRLAVCGHTWLHSFTSIGLQNENIIELFVKRAQELKFKPIFVFDGEDAPIKATERMKRNDGNRIDVNLIINLVKSLKLNGFVYMIAPYEADSVLNHLVNIGAVDAIMANDGDIMVTAGFLLMRHTQADREKKKDGCLYSFYDFYETTNEMHANHNFRKLFNLCRSLIAESVVSNRQILAMISLGFSLLVGNDYSKQIYPGVGEVAAVNILVSYLGTRRGDASIIQDVFSNLFTPTVLFEGILQFLDPKKLSLRDSADIISSWNLATAA